MAKSVTVVKSISPEQDESPRDYEFEVLGCTQERVFSVLSGINMVGMNIIFNPKFSMCTRFVWFTSLVLCSMLCLVWTYDRIAYYYSTPISTSVQMIETRQLMFPALTFCDYNRWSMEAMDRLVKETRTNATTIEDLIGVQGKTVKDIWDAAAHQVWNLTHECYFGRGVTCYQAGDFKKIYTVLGTCYTLIFKNKTKLSGSYHNLYLKLLDNEALYGDTGLTGFKLLFHTPDYYPNLEIMTRGFTMPRRWGKDVQVFITEYETLSTDHRPCDESMEYQKSYCMLRCFSQEMYKQSECVMPYMTGVDGPGCDTKETYLRAQKVFEQLFLFGKWNTSGCDCDRACDDTVYGISEEVTALDDRTANFSKLRAYFNDMIFTAIVENQSYSRIAMMCHIGGALGLLMGASVLDLVELIEATLRTFTKTSGRLSSAIAPAIGTKMK